MLVRIPWKITKLQSQHSMLSQHAKRHLNGVSLEGRWLPALSGTCIWILSPLIKENKSWTPPLTKLSGSAHVLPGHSVWAIILTGWVIDNLGLFRLVKVFSVKVVQLKHTKIKNVFRTSSTALWIEKLLSCKMIIFSLQKHSALIALYNARNPPTLYVCSFLISESKHKI